MANIIVKDVSGLTAALKSAQAGDTIKLAAGDYAGFTLNSVKFGGAGVTVTSLDPANEARLHGFHLRGCEGVNFKDLEFVADPAKLNPYQIIDSAKINFDNLFVHGSLNGDAQDDQAGIFIRRSADVTVTNSEFQQLEFGVSHIDSKRIEIDGNKFDEIREDGVRGGGTSDITVSNNVFTNFQPKEGDHADAIQFWTSHTTTSASNIIVTGNLVMRGQGDAIQGIFFRDQVGTLPFKNVLISDNAVIGGLANGIRVNGGDGVTILDNVVAEIPGQGSAIGLAKVTNVTLTNNAASYYGIESTVTGLTETGNTELGEIIDGGLAAANAFLAGNAVVAALVPTGWVAELSQGALTVMNDLRRETKVITGTDGDDRLSTPQEFDTFLDGGAGEDILASSGIGHNTLSGGAGDDIYRLGSTTDVVVEAAGGGYDQVVASVDVILSANIEKLTLIGEARVAVANDLSNSIGGSALGQTISAMGGDDNIQSAGGDDKVLGGDGADTIYGGDGGDTIQGDAGSDRLRGDAGDDSLAGGDGNDTVAGSDGADWMSGGLGADLFQFGNGDIGVGETIFDFSRAEGDRLTLSAIDSNVNATGNQAFAFIGTSAFSKVAGQLRYEVSGSDSFVMGDLNGDGAADFKILMQGVNSFSSSDFVL